MASGARARVHAFGISLDAFSAGPEQGFENPLGKGGQALLDWAFPTRSFRRMHGENEGTTGTDDDFVARGVANIGAWIMGRNMFGPVRGPWSDDRWKGWWGENPPFHTPVFVLTHYEREPLVMEGGTTFHFVTGGIRYTLRRAAEAANGKDVRIGGGVATVQQYLRECLIDEMHIAIVPVLLGSGERLFSDVDLLKLGYGCTEHACTPNAQHVVLRRKQR